MTKPSEYFPVLKTDNLNAQPIWGAVTQMLLFGGPWPGDPVQTCYGWKKGTRIPITKPRRKEYYPGEFFTEPKPEISNLTTTAKLIKRMVMAGWSKAQIAAALFDDQNLGGAFYRFEAAVSSDSGAGFLTRMIEGTDLSTTTQPPTTYSAGEGSRRLPSSKSYSDVWMTVDGFEVRHHTARLVLEFIAREPCTQNALQHSGAVHPRVYKRYLDALANAGLVTITPKVKHKTKDGKMRPCTLVTAAPVEVVRMRLSEAAEADLPLWEALAEHHMQQPIAERVAEAWAYLPLLS